MSTEEQDAIQTTQIDGDVSVGRNVALGGGFISQGKGRVKGDLVVDGWLEAKNIKGVFKGIYLTVEKLKADFPEPEDGWWAIVGKTIPGPIYAADNGKWVATGEIGGQPTISGDEYYETLFEVLQYLTEEFDAFAATKGMPNGLAPLDSETKIPATYLPSYVDDVIEFAKTVESVTVQPSAIDKSSTDSGCSVIYDKAKNVFVLSVTDSTGTKYYKDWNDSDIFGNENDIGIVPTSGKVYVDNYKNKTYRWSGTKLVVIGSDLSLGYTEATAFPGSDGKELQQTVALQEQAITALTSTVNSWDNKILNKLDKSVWDSIFVLHKEDEEDPSKITSIEVKANLWTNGNISAGGQREGGSGGSTGGIIQTVYRYTQLNITLSDNDKTNTFNAYTIQQLANRISTLETTPSGISSLTVNLGTTSYAGVGTTDVTVNLPAYPTTLPASDVYAWAKQPNKPSYTAAEVGALTQAAGDGRYLKLAGGIMSGTDETILTVNTAKSNNYVYFSCNNTKKASVGFYNGIAGISSETTGSPRIGIQESTGIPVYSPDLGVTCYPILHSNNYASYLDTRYVKKAGDTMTGALTVNTGSGTILVLDSDIKLWANAAGGWARSFVVCNSSGESAFTNGAICGAFGSGNTLNYLYYGGRYDSPAISILPSNEYVGIGTNAPAMKLHVVGDARFDGWIYSDNQHGWYNFTYGGGIYMKDSTWVRVYNAKGFLVDNDIYTTTKVIAVGGYQVGPTPGVRVSYVQTYLSLESAGNEMCIGGGSAADGIYINYRKPSGGYAPAQFLWKAGSSSSWADFALGSITANGNVTATGQVSAGNASDRRLKSNITTLTERETAHVLSHLNPVSFTWNAKAEELSGGDKKGIARSFVADEFLSMLPNAGRKMWNDYDAIYTEQVVPYLTKGWQMHERRLSDHERRIVALERENAELKRELSRRA